MSKDKKKKTTIGGHDMEISNLDKVFFPGVGYSKGDLVDYYERVATTMLRHVAGRPITMLRAPGGFAKKEKKFYQQEVPDYFPTWIHTSSVKKEDGTRISHAVIENEATLVYLADQACVTPHIWLSKKGALDKPDKMLFDLDPAGDDFSQVKRAAEKLKNFFDDLDIACFVMTTGSKGLHIAIPLKPRWTFSRLRELARRTCEELAQKNPKELTVEHRKKKRQGRLFLDYTRNARAQTSVAPYAVRLRAGAPVALPIEWSELAGLSASGDYDIKKTLKRLAAKDDPWQNIWRHRVSPDTIKKKLT